ncbi:TPA: biopolymer transporter ExbB [bacterium]|nr:biopolymer transporter ExbB [bacterium]
MREIIKEGGVVMYPIILCSILALTIIIERLIVLYRLQVSTRRFVVRLRKILPHAHGNPMEVAAFCEGFSSPLAQVLLAGLLKANQSKRELKEAIEFAGSRAAQSLGRYLEGLATIAKITPLLGLLGTVVGMIKVFKKILEIQMAGEGVNPSALAEGIGNALITTAAGLGVAIPVIVFHHYLTSRVDKFVTEIEGQSNEFVDTLFVGKRN